MKIAVYAFANTAFFFRALIASLGHRKDVEWSVVIPRGHYVSLFDGVVPASHKLYLYADFNARYARDRFIDGFACPPGADNIYVSLSKDKDGYCHLDKEEQLRRAATIYRIYKEFLTRVRPEYMLFPDLEVVDGFILINLCYELGIVPIYYVSTRLLGRCFFSYNCYEELPAYFGEATDEDRARATSLLRRVRDGGLKALPPPEPHWPTHQPPRRPALIPRTIRSVWRTSTTERLHAGEDSVMQRIRTVIRPVVYRYRASKFQIRQAGFFDVPPDLSSLPERFVLYALQYTPESSINGLEPYYVDQLRVIDQLIAALPNEHWLLVKEHPAMIGERSAAFYRQLRRRAGVVLVDPRANSQDLALRARLVATVTGTIGLECFFLDRPCLLFGRNFFAHLCYRFGDWASKSDFISRILAEYHPRSEEEKVTALAQLLHVSYSCKVGDPISEPAIMAEQNIAAYWAAITDHIHRLRALGPKDAKSDAELI
jgi:hypothetical protein